VAVYSRDKDVDPVGACVGIKGSRVQNIIRELRGEKIDIVEWSEDPRSFAINALNPAKVSRVSIVDEREKVMEVIVEDKQLSLAIGKKGQNVRLAARLIGWRIDIKSEEEKKLEVQSQMDAMSATQTPLERLSGVSEKVMQKLAEHGFTSVEELASLDPDVLTEIPGVGAKTAERIVSSARSWLEGGSAPPLEDVEPQAVEESAAEEALVAPELAEEALSPIGEPERQPEMAESEPDGSGGER
jgi:N utilization substance protein A